MSGAGRIWIGTSGYVYRHWRKGVFYPPGLPLREQLAYYASRFPTVELNNPFYRLPTAEMFGRWRAITPDDFQFAVKASRYITHVKRLRNVSEEVALFMERAAPNQQLDIPRLEQFLPSLSPGHRWVLEFRHPSWHTEAVYRLLTQHAVALCIPVGGGLHPDRITTTGFTYLRMHRGQEPRGGFTANELKTWAAQVRALSNGGKDVYVYFNNDWEGFAIRDATTLRELLGIPRERAPSGSSYSTQ